MVTSTTSIAGTANYFDQSQFKAIDETLAGDDRVDGVLASIMQRKLVVY
jgi:hypothetical protein